MNSLLNVYSKLPAGIKSELKILAPCLVVVFLTGWIFSQFTLLLLIFLVTYIIWHASCAFTFYRWLQKNLKSKPPGLAGIWREMANLLEEKKQLRIKSIQRMRHAIKRNSQLTHAIDEGILVLSDDFSIRSWNVAAKEQLGLQPSDLGYPLTSLIREPALAKYLMQDKIKGRFELPSRVNPLKWLMFTASHFGDGEIVVVISDITPLKNTERLRKEFVGNVSHELRTPITVLRGYLETISDGMITDNPLLQKACKQMSEQVVRMQDLADDLIVLSKLESQPAKIEKQKIKLLPLLETLLNEARIVSENKHKFTLNCPDGVYMMAQESDLHSAIGNLIINAVHHNPQGANIDINVTVDEHMLNISVKDDGVGINAEAVPKLTERFYRTDSSRNSKVGGSGLGLAIVKHVVSRYDGKLAIKTRLKEGAEFICSFPLEEGQTNNLAM